MTRAAAIAFAFVAAFACKPPPTPVVNPTLISAPVPWCVPLTYAASTTDADGITREALYSMTVCVETLGICEEVHGKIERYGRLGDVRFVGVCWQDGPTP